MFKVPSNLREKISCNLREKFMNYALCIINYALLKRFEVFDGFVHGVYHACQLSFGEFPLCGVSHHGMCHAQAVVLLPEIDQLMMRPHHLLPQAAVLLRKQ